MPRLPGLPNVEIRMRRSARARRLSLRVASTDGAVTLTLPPRVPEAEAVAFLRAQEDWLRRALARLPGVERVGIGTRLPVEGRLLELTAGGARGGVRVEGEALVVPGAEARAGARVLAWLRTLARDRLAAASDRHAARLGRSYSTLALRDTRSRWGSCTSDGRLMYSWRLVLAPPQVLDYVAAHEVAHLARMDHSPAFWATVGDLMPGYAGPRKWLRTEGQRLHGFSFGD